MGANMAQKSRWVVRRMACPEERGESRVLLEYQVERGKKVLKSISCDHPMLKHYSGEDCQWLCLEKISPMED
jgi:hypothetical protein